MKKLILNPVSGFFDYIDDGGSYWASPVADLTTLQAIVTDVDGTIRVTLDTNDAYRWNLSSVAWQYLGLVKEHAIGSSPNANGFSVSVNNTLTLQPADGTHPGLITTGTQTLAGNKTFSGTVTATVTGTASGNTTYSANNHGVVVSSSTNTMTVVAPDASTSKVLVSGGSSADPSWSLLTNSNLSGSAAITNANLASMTSSSSTVGTVKGNISGGSTTPSDIILTSANTSSSAVYRDGSGNFSAGTITASVTGSSSGNLLKAAGDLNETSFSAANNQSVAANVTGLAFTNATVRSFEALISVYVNATSSLYESFKLYGIQRGSDWMLAQTSVGDASGFTFTITTAGAIQYTNSNYTGFVAATVKFRSLTTSV